MRGKANAVVQARKLLNRFNRKVKSDEGKDSFFTDLGGIASNLDINVMFHPFTDNISGVFFRKNEKLYLGVNSSHHEHRQRFTIAHEIGHYILHSEETLHYDVNDMENLYFRADKISNFAEFEANQFAAELLMPEEKIQQVIHQGVENIDSLADAFRVSKDAMRYRLINLGFL